MSKDVKDKICKAFECSRPTVWRALTYATDTPMARSIRRYAILSGGRVLQTVVIDPKEQTHNIETNSNNILTDNNNTTWKTSRR